MNPLLHTHTPSLEDEFSGHARQKFAVGCAFAGQCAPVDQYVHDADPLSVLNEPIAQRTQGPPDAPVKPLSHTQSLSAMFMAPPDELGTHAIHEVAAVYGL